MRKWSAKKWKSLCRNVRSSTRFLMRPFVVFSCLILLPWRPGARSCSGACATRQGVSAIWGRTLENRRFHYSTIYKGTCPISLKSGTLLLSYNTRRHQLFRKCPDYPDSNFCNVFCSLKRGIKGCHGERSWQRRLRHVPKTPIQVRLE